MSGKSKFQRMLNFQNLNPCHMMIRYNFLDDSKKRVLASYGFPLGFRPKFGPKRPANELIPTQFDSNGSSQPCYMQFLIFYESLEE